MIKKIINVVLFVVLFLLPLIISPRGISPEYYNIPKIITLYVCGSTLLVCLFIKRKELKFDKADKLLLIFMALIIISTIFSVNIKKSILGERNRYEGLLTFICYFLIYYCAKYYFKFDTDFINNSFVVIGITTFLATLQFYNVPIIYDIFGLEITGKSFASATFGNRNFFGSFVSIILPYTMCLYIFYHKKIYLFMASLSFYSMLISLTRSAWVAFGMFSIIGIIYIIKLKNKDFLKHALILFIMFIFVFGIFYFSSSSLSSSSLFKGRLTPQKHIGSGRIIIWKTAFKIIESNPIIGSGPDNFLVELYTNHTNYLFNEVYPTLGSLPDKAHNEYLHIAATIGIPGLVVYLLFITITFKKLVEKNLMTNRPSFIIFLCLLSYLVQAFFNISTIGVAPLFYFLLGYSYQTSNCLQLKEKSSQI